MLHKETVETGTLDLIKQLMADSRPHTGMLFTKTHFLNVSL